jgi:hypothetical protein
MFPIQPCLNPYNIIQQYYLTVPLKAIIFQKDIIQDHSRHCCLLLENNFSTNYQDPRTIYQDPQDEDLLDCYLLLDAIPPIILMAS